MHLLTARPFALVLVTGVVLVAACSGGGKAGSSTGSRGASSGGGASGHSAAEPADSPPATVLPAGAYAPVGDAPEGIVYDSATSEVAVAVRNPDRLAILDAATLSVRRTVALPGFARHLQLGVDDTVLVPVEGANVLMTVHLPDGATTTTKVGVSPHDAAQVGPRIVVGDERGESLTMLSAASAAGTSTVRVERTVGQVTQPGGVIADGTDADVVDVQAYTVSTFDPASGTRTDILDAGAGPTHGVLAGPRQVAVTDTRGQALLLFATHPLRQVQRVQLPGSPYGIGVSPTTANGHVVVWVTLTARNEVVGVDVSAAPAAVVARYPTLRQPNSVTATADGHTVWVTGTNGGMVQRITR